jgi:hypothetical protein
MMAAKKSQGSLVGKRCPECGGTFVEEIQAFTLRTEFLGNYLFWVCTRCGETLVPPDTSELLDKVAKAKGLFGAGLKEERSSRTHHSAGRKTVAPSLA